MSVASENREIPTLPGRLILQNLYGDLPNFLLRATAEHGPIIRFRANLPLRKPFDFFFFNEPRAIEEVLVTHGPSFRKARGTRRLRQIVGTGLLTSDEPAHLANRRLMQPAFHRRRLEGFARTMTRATIARVASWGDGSIIDVDREMNALALEIVAEALFGVDIGSEIERIAHALDATMAMHHFWQTPFSEYADDWPLPNVRAFKAAREELRGIVMRIVREHRANAQERDDLISMLVAARDEEGRGGLDDEQIRDEALTILLAGHETTANALAWTFYVLQRRPDIVATLQAHVAQVVGEREIGFDDVPALDYARAVFSETLRLYPPAWITSREAISPVRIAGVDVPGGSVALLAPYVTHRDPRYWDDPDTYDPQRFVGGSPARERYAYYPFGGGSRMCIGDSFAWTEGVIVLATIAQRAQLKRIPGEADVVPHPLVTLRPRSAIRARVAARRVGESPAA